MILSIARQLVAGPGELYGPFGGRNPLVLIHAPLYYRLAALSAWPIAQTGIHPVIAARLAGRGLSALGLLSTLATAYRLARSGGMPRAVQNSILLRRIIVDVGLRTPCCQHSAAGSFLEVGEGPNCSTSHVEAW